MLKKLKKKFRNIKKLPDWFYLPPYLIISIARKLMRTEIRDPYKVVDISKFPVITVTWHNRLLFFPAMFEREMTKRTMALISPSRDGQYIADLALQFGVRSIRGSTSKKGSQALHECVKTLKAGTNVSITPDGPRGPRYIMSRGPVALASMTGYPVVPLAVNYSSYWEIPSWDRFQIPKPWAKISLVLGEPIKIPPDLDDKQLEEWRKILEDKLKETSNCEDR